jgi:hypothetical protein
MEFKIGDKVKHKYFGVGEIIGFDVHYNKYAVEFENERKGSLHTFPLTYKKAGLDNPLDREAGRWCYDNEIELVEKKLK